jgi:hypothetical protein
MNKIRCPGFGNLSLLKYTIKFPENPHKIDGHTRSAFECAAEDPDWNWVPTFILLEP